MNKFIRLVIASALTLSMVACNSTQNNNMQNSSGSLNNGIGNNSSSAKGSESSSVSKGTKYTYLHDKWNLYIATVLSDTAIKIEQWGRFTAGEDGDPFEYESDICILKTNYSSFKWIYDEHTDFYCKIHDPENSYWETETIVGFSIEDSDSAVLGVNFSDVGANYIYLHDEWNLYRAVALSASTIKIEQWGRFTAGKDGDPFEYESDICIIDVNASTTDFEWLDDEHTCFMITMQDPENYYWEEPSTVSFAIDNR